MVHIVIRDENVDMLKVYNTIGQEVFSKAIDGKGENITLDLSHLQTGVYVLKYVKEGTTISSDKILLSK